VCFEKKTILEAANDVLVGDAGDGGSYLEEALGLGPQEIVHLLFKMDKS
jgi:hypothetical protein